jgi:hypothetical protein
VLQAGRDDRQPPFRQGARHLVGFGQCHLVDPRPPELIEIASGVGCKLAFDRCLLTAPV